MKIKPNNQFVKIFNYNKGLLNEIEVQQLISIADNQSKLISSLRLENQKLKDFIYIKVTGKN